jgi:hypothetical protein
MQEYRDADRDIPSWGAGNVIDELERAIERAKKRRVKNPRSISLRKLEAVLCRENGCIDSHDVEPLMVVIYEEVGLKPPKRIKDAAKEAERQIRLGHY